MKNLLDFINLFGIQLNINENTNPIVLIALSYLIFTCIILLSVVNISIYLLSLYIINNNKFLNKIVNKYPFINKIINFYSSTRIGFILLEVVFLFLSIGYMIRLSLRLIINLS